jgi:hypothetical protein
VADAQLAASEYARTTGKDGEIETRKGGVMHEQLIATLRKDLADCIDKASQLRLAISALMALDGTTAPLTIETRPVSKQREYQRRQNAAGLCGQCKEPLAPDSKSFCLKHLAYNREYHRKRQGCKPWQPGGAGRPQGQGVQ